MLQDEVPQVAHRVEAEPWRIKDHQCEIGLRLFQGRWQRYKECRRVWMAQHFHGIRQSVWRHRILATQSLTCSLPKAEQMLAAFRAKTARADHRSKDRQRLSEHLRRQQLVREDVVLHPRAVKDERDHPRDSAENQKSENTEDNDSHERDC